MESVPIISIAPVTHDVLQIRAVKPKDLVFQPGQAVDFSIDKPGWEQELRPFTFTSLPEDDYVEFTIKTYPDHQGVTAELLKLQAGDRVILHEVFGDIHYKGPGIFLAGGAGITPFIAIFKQLDKENRLDANKLIFANKTSADIILNDTFQRMLGARFINVLSQEQNDQYEQGYITAALIKKHQDTPESYFYLCGPDPMMEAVSKELSGMGIPEDKVVREGF